ncbi:MAG: hypothetical protein GC166_14175 [Alphaproteobacteria bacterium]|nr:hypothetical protein [Alphaproteobacteria bacterium]
MRWKVFAIVASVAALFAASSASAQTSLVVGADFSSLKFDSFGDIYNQTNVAGSVSTEAGAGIVIEADGSYHRISDNFYSTKNWTAGGSVFWKGEDGRIGINAAYNDIDVLTTYAPATSLTSHVTNYGVFGEWWPTSDITLGLKAGAYNGTGTKGAYVGGKFDYYALPNIAFHISVDYTKEKSGSPKQTDISGGFEWLAIKGVPVSLYGDYTYSKNETTPFGSQKVGTFSIGLRLYLDDEGGTLVSRQRQGTAGWANAFVTPVLPFP